ncbi:4-carboxymuconolactone decarboxylase [Alkalilacustris brevis]|uniref:4-carboxymuconolactone decarboxylase n=1 Tax=Alkalilacustris brevis TaxID=2026338 RepID=UPI000E0DABE1|nr:4-carboxymuconolactone decarboxylase [Alkalilacustris brevis]
MADEITKLGEATRRRILGDAHVERTRPSPGRMDEPFIAMITDAAWGHVWGRDTISDRERSMMTIALLAGLGNFEELAMHIRATARTGASQADVTEALMHVAIYAGLPRANHGFKIARDIFAELETEENRK